MKSKKDDDARVRIPRELYRRVGHAAIDAGKSRPAWIVRAILEKLERLDAALGSLAREGGGDS